MSTYVKSFALTDGVELGSVVLSHNLSIWIFLIAGLLDMLAATSICLCLKLYIVFYRLGESVKLVIRKRSDGLH